MHQSFLFVFSVSEVCFKTGEGGGENIESPTLDIVPPGYQYIYINYLRLCLNC